MKNEALMSAFASLETDVPSLTKLLKKTFKKNSSTHEMRVFFKKLKAHIVLLHALGSDSIQMSDALLTYYKQIGIFRDAKIFRTLCKKHTQGNKFIMVLGEERVVKAKEKIKAYKKTIHPKLLAEEIHELVNKIIFAVQSFDSKWVEVGLDTFLEHTENLLMQLLQSDTLTNVGLHTIRKHIKKAMYLLDYMRLFDKVKYTPIKKTYKKFAQNLGDWNDLQLLVDQLEAMPWKGKEEKIVKKLVEKEQKIKKKILKKMRIYFRVGPKQAIKETQRISSPQKAEKTSNKSNPVTSEPVVHKMVTNEAVAKKKTTKKQTSLTNKTDSGKQKAIVAGTVVTATQKAHPKKKAPMNSAKKKTTAKTKNAALRKPTIKKVTSKKPIVKKTTLKKNPIKKTSPKKPNSSSSTK